MHVSQLCWASVFYLLDIKPSETTVETTHSSTGSSSPSDWVSSSPLRYSELLKHFPFDCECCFIANLECASFTVLELCGGKKTKVVVQSPKQTV